MDKLVVAVAQFMSLVGDKEYNYKKMEKLARQAREEHKADLLLFPEVSLTGGGVYSREDVMKIGEELHGEYVERFRALSKELDMDISFGMVERDGDKCYNTLVLCEPDGNFGWYRKVHLPHAGCDCFVDRGDKFVAMDTRFGKVGLMICYDLRFPEIARALALDGARLLLVSSCMSSEGSKRVLSMLVRARALENRVFVLYSNWVGKNEKVTYLGLSHMADPVGDILADAGGTEEGIVSHSIDLSVADDKSILAPYCDVFIFEDRQPQCYGRLMEK